MFIYTRAAFNKVVCDLKRVNYIYNIISPLFSICFMIYALAVGTGIIAVNILIAVLTLAWLVTYLICYPKGEEAANTMRKSRHIINRLKIAVRAVSLAVSIYGIYIANERVTVFSVLFAAAGVLGWTLQVALELITCYIENQVEFILEGFKADMEGITKPVKTVETVIKRITRKSEEDGESENKPNKKRLVLEEYAGKIKTERKRKREEGRLYKLLGKFKRRTQNTQD